MKIGILTFHAAKNYGAVLQCRCLYEVLKGLGHDVSVIDYRPDYLTAPYRLWKNSYLKHPGSILKVGTHLAGALRREAAFSSFEKEMRLSPMEGECFDAIFYGSDQIWNKDLTQGPDPVFYGVHPCAEGAKRISYAASDGDVELTAEELSEIRTYLHGFSHIGVRERSMVDRLDEAGIPAVQNIDPVLLAGKEVVSNLASGPLAGKPYVLCYEAIDNPATMAKAQLKAVEKGLDIIRIARSPYSPGTNKYGPREFVALFRDADYVVTTSFHGTALSLLFGKDHEYIHCGSKADGRIDSLLESLGSDTEKGLAKMREQSLDYIKEALAEL